MSLRKRLADKFSRSYRSLLFSFGLEFILYQKKSAKDVVIMYHNVLENTRRDLNLRNISQADFRLTLRYLRKRYQIVSLKEMMTTTSDSSRLAVTFDDGLINNLRYALPVIEELEIPTTFFITTSWLQGQSVLWPDEISYHLQFVEGNVEFQKKEFTRFYQNQFRSLDSTETLESRLLLSPHDLIEVFLKDLRKRTNRELPDPKVKDDDWRILKGEEIKILCGSKFVDIGSHTVTHQNLVLLDDEKLHAELSESKKYLEQVCQKDIELFAFPFGLYNEEVLRVAHQNGYRLLAGVVKKENVEIHNYNMCFRLGLYNDRSVWEQLHQINKAFE